MCKLKPACIILHPTADTIVLVERTTFHSGFSFPHLKQRNMGKRFRDSINPLAYCGSSIRIESEAAK